MRAKALLLASSSIVLLAVAIVFELPIVILGARAARRPQLRDSCAATGASATSSMAADRGRAARHRPGHDDRSRCCRSCCSSRARSGSPSSWSAASRAPRRRYSERPMARAAVKAKSRQQQGGRAAGEGAARRAAAPRRHAGGGNPNQDLFFMRLRRRAKFVYVLLAVALRDHVRVPRCRLGLTAGSTSSSRAEHLPGSGTSVSKAQKHIKDHPQSEGLPRARDRIRGEGRQRQRDHRAPAVHEHEAEGREVAERARRACS